MPGTNKSDSFFCICFLHVEISSSLSSLLTIPEVHIDSQFTASLSQMAQIVGIMAVQGNFAQHSQLVQRLLGMPTQLVRYPAQLQHVHGLVIPGGESTVLSRLMGKGQNSMREAIISFAKSGRPVLGTCAGLIMLSSKLHGYSHGVTPLGLIDVEVERNAYGSQIHSRADFIELAGTGARTGETMPADEAMFIRAPVIREVLSRGKVEVLATYNGRPCAVRQGQLMGLAFHPETMQDGYFHRLCFSELLRGSSPAGWAEPTSVCLQNVE